MSNPYQEPARRPQIVSDLRSRWRAVDLTGEGAAWLGAAGEVSAGDHPLSQRWANALWGHPALPDCIYYRARHDQSRLCAAIFNRAQGCISVDSTIRLLDPSFRDRLGAMLDEYRFSLM